MKKFQIKTHRNENLARVIQEKLFELGYKWRDSGKQVTCLNEYLYRAFEDGDMLFGYQDDIDGTLITLDELFAMSPEPKETIKIGDQTYDKAEFDKATENLKPIK